MHRANILVLAGGSAGLIAAPTLKRLIPDMEVRLLRSPEIGIIGVGEGTTPVFPGRARTLERAGCRASAPRRRRQDGRRSAGFAVRFQNHLASTCHSTRFVNLSRNAGFLQPLRASAHPQPDESGVPTFHKFVVPTTDSEFSVIHRA